jgi:tRNA-dihydrouridine synthase
MAASYSLLPKPFFCLAPMEDVTDLVFRQVVRDCCAPELFFTEFVNVDGVQSPGRQKVGRRLRLGPDEDNVIAQLWGLKPENFYKTAREIAEGEFGSYTGIDLNMGCPEKTVVKSGACSGLINNPDLAIEIIEATQEGANGKLPVSVKTRLGFNEVNFDWPTLLLRQNLAMLTIHARTRKEMSKVPAHWEDISTIANLRTEIAPHTLLVGNGDVMSRGQGIKLANEHGLDGIMIGRGVFQDPYVFSENSPWASLAVEQKILLYKRHVELFDAVWSPGVRAVHTLNKFCKIYINGFDGAKEMREELMLANSTKDLLSILNRNPVNFVGPLVI